MTLRVSRRVQEGDHDDSVALNPVVETVREALDEVTTHPAMNGWIRFGEREDLIDRLLHVFCTPRLITV